MENYSAVIHFSLVFQALETRKQKYPQHTASQGGSPVQKPPIPAYGQELGQHVKEQLLHSI